MEQIEKTRKQIRKLYGKYPWLINDSKQLVILVLENYGFKMTQEQRKAFYTAPSVEAIYRSARIVRAENDYEIGKAVAAPVKEKRFKLFKWFRGA